MGSFFFSEKLMVILYERQVYQAFIIDERGFLGKIRNELRHLLLTL